MSKYYNPLKTKNLYDPKSAEPFRLSRSKIDSFLKCQRCFYLENRLGVSQPPGYPFSLNSAVDTLLKKEFDVHRVNATAHPLVKAYGLDYVPFKHKDIDRWRTVDFGRGGVRYFHAGTNFDVGGVVDDIWVTSGGELVVVDYKATAKAGEVSLDAEWQEGYKRQVEVYQWLLKKNEFKVLPTAYFVYANGDLDAEAFDGKLEFSVKLIPYEGDTAWVEPTLIKAKACLVSDEVPDAHEECDYCRYRFAVKRVEGGASVVTKKESKKAEKPKTVGLF